ncbi:MAG: hypothetical protein KGZ80_06390 [Methylomonas sp.]|nr:hypothetical protein [Methylomonas sp.]
MKRSACGIVLGFAGLLAGASPASSAPNGTGLVKFSGEISRGTSFEKKLWNGLIFILKATDDGWDITIADASDAATDFVWVVTPPYRFDNPRYLGAVYGRSAAEAVAWTPRAFSFVENRADYWLAEDAVRKLLWPSDLPTSELHSAEQRLAQMSRANGLLKIKQAALFGKGKDGRIESLAFEVEIRAAIDLKVALRSQFLAKNPEYASVAEACSDEDAPVRIGKVLYHDFNGDGFDETAVLGYSCLAGTGGSDLHGIFTRLPNGETAELAISDAGPEKTDASLRGHFDIDIIDGHYAEEHRIYRDKDPNCCPTGGIRQFIYQWNGKAFVPVTIKDISEKAVP